MYSDIITLIILAAVFAIPLTGYLLTRWGFEEADHHSSLPF
jgi:hypothetical protein